MEEKINFSSKESKELYENSLHDPELTKALLQASMDEGNYTAAMRFAENLELQMPDSYLPVHAKCAILMAKDQIGDIGILLAEMSEKFGDDPNYIIDRLAYTIEIFGTSAAKKYLKKIEHKPAFESKEFFELCARVYNAEGDEESYIKCLYILHKQYMSETARFLLALKSIEHQKFETALKWFAAVINGYSGSAEYFMALAGRCGLLKFLNRDNWREETLMAANQMDLASLEDISKLWLRSISSSLWDMLDERENAEYNRQLIVELERFAEDPTKYMQQT